MAPAAPASPLFESIHLRGGDTLRALPQRGVSEAMSARLSGAPRGACVFRGIPFDARHILALDERPAQVPLGGRKARWLVFLHTSDARPLNPGPGGIISPMRGEGQLGELACTYRVRFAGGDEGR